MEIFHESKTVTFALGIGLLLCVALGGVLFIVLRLGDQAKLRMQENQVKEYAAPTEAVKRQVKKIIITHQTKKGEEETLEIGIDGKVTRYDKNHTIIKTGSSGFGTVRNLFEDVEQWLDSNKSFNLPSGVQIIIETNKGSTTIDSNTNHNPGSSPDPGGSIIDDIINIIDKTLNPTPQPTPRVNNPTPTPINATPQPSPDASPDASTLPAYMTAPPFTCADYYKNGSKPLKISGIYCNQ